MRGFLSVSEKLACGDLFRQGCAVRLLRLRLHRAADGVRKPCCARLPNPPRMSLDSEYSSEGCGPPNLPKGFFDSLGRPLCGGFFFYAGDCYIFGSPNPEAWEENPDSFRCICVSASKRAVARQGGTQMIRKPLLKLGSLVLCAAMLLMLSLIHISEPTRPY